jgi:phosphoribosylformylglycinamidine cyclo-ligase
MCNGLTLARLCLLSKQYQQKYPEIADPEGKGYYGRHKIDTYIEELGITVGEALVSPMRFYSPVVFKMLEEHQEDITGLVHNMGGGQTKGLRIGKNINFMKDNIVEPDPIFHLIQKESGENWKSMFEIFNMGTGFEIIARPEVENDILDISESFGLEAKTIGRCEKSSGLNKVTIICSWGKFQFQHK